jgi:hypothetical protein
VPVPISRYCCSSHYLWAGLAALVVTVVSGWVALTWPVAWFAAGLSLGSAAVVLFLAVRPPIEIYESHLKIGGKAIPWMQIRRLDRSSRVPLIVRLTLTDKTRILLVHPGDPDSTTSLLRHLRRFSREALIDGVPYRQFWGEALTPAPERKQAPPRYPLLLPEDEAEVERLLQRLKSVGHLDSRTSSEDK